MEIQIHQAFNNIGTTYHRNKRVNRHMRPTSNFDGQRPSFYFLLQAAPNSKTQNTEQCEASLILYWNIVPKACIATIIKLH
mmetsp:Transcript_13295/g.19558  ORF Transcript_13295/g.19558 Transcript_13295/m.19558 type:complete len:81 (+) Transcript_13295:121-363(+)